jgi:DNA-binding NarL/FixJ family response regulator
VLQLLTTGLKDEAIARQLGTSMRTTRRRIASLLATLGVATRFQAGVEAARRGLL